MLLTEAATGIVSPRRGKREVYGSNARRDWLKDRGAHPIIPSRSSCKVQLCDEQKLYRERNYVECRFEWLDDFRCIFTRFDCNVKNLMVVIDIVAVVIWWCQRV